MRGHDALIAMRRGGFRPNTVAIHTGVDHSGAWRDWQEMTPKHADVEIASEDALSSLDLRFTVGMFVVVTGDDPFRVAAIHALCIAAGAKRVLSAAVKFDGPNDPGTLGRVLDSAEAA